MLDDYDAVKSAEKILEGILSAPKPPTAEQLVQAYAVERLGLFWDHCQVRCHRLVSGQEIYTVCKFCLACGYSHAFVIELLSNGELALVEPLLEE